MTNYVSRFFVTGLMLSVLAACTTTPYQPSQPPVDDRSNLPPQQPTPETHAYPPVEEAIPGQSIPSHQAPPPQAQLPQKQSAQNNLQRAQRIAPRDPKVYYSLAQTHMSLEDYDLAEQVALKGVSLSSGNQVLLKRFWQLITEIRLRAGDVSGAEVAKLRAQKY
jgi:predicted Zn-dependent protease